MVERRTQAQRSDATRAALADAALELLVERGWAATTTVAICDRAGLTRGALLHHFDGLPDLMAAALRRLYDTYAEAAMAPANLREAVDEMWAVVGQPSFKAAIEAWMASGNDPELGPALQPVIADFAKLVDPRQRLAYVGRTADETVSFVLTAREALLGLALGRAVDGGRALPHEARVLDRLRAQADQLDLAHSDATTKESS